MARAISLTDAEVYKVLSILTGRRRYTTKYGGFFKRQPPSRDPKHLPDDDAVIAQALAILASRIRSTDTLASPAVVRDYLKLLLGSREHEVFVVVLLDAQNRVLHAAELFRGTLTQTSVYPREVVKLALATNAAAVIFAHNHPSGVSEPSRADELLTSQLKSALALVDVRVLDHFIVAGAAAVSFSERGLL